MISKTSHKNKLIYKLKFIEITLKKTTTNKIE